MRSLARFLTALVLAGLWHGAAAAAGFSPEMTEVIAAAKAEGALTLSWGEGTLGGTNGTPLFERGIADKFGVDIPIVFTPGASMPQVGNDIAMRVAAGQPSETDVYIGYADVVSRLAPRKLFLAAPWQKMLPGRITDAIVDLDGTVLKLMTALPGIAYNKQLAPAEPKLLVDLLKPEWKGKIAATPYAANFDVLAANDSWGPERAIEFARKLSDQVSGLMRCNEGERLATGEFVAFALTCQGTDFFDLIEKGAPIVQAPVADFPVLGYFYVAVPKNAVHPNAAKLYVAFLMTPEGQALVRKLGGSDLDRFAETATHQRVAELEQERGNKFVQVDVNWYAAHPEAYEAWKEIDKIFTAKK